MDWQSILAWTVALSAVAFVGSLLALPVLIARLPADYFARPDPPPKMLAQGHPALRLALTVAKNLLGMLLILAGIVMLVTPGQGLLAIVMGLLLVDFAGKRALERRLVGRPVVLRAMNAIRARARRPPLLAPQRE